MSTIKLISTSALAKKMSISKYQLDEQLLAAKFVIKEGNTYTLTELGMQKSGTLKNHVKFGEYIVWDENLDLPNKSITQGKDFHSSTKIAMKFDLSARKINLILSEIGFIEKYLKGWTITILGSKNGGIQKENAQNGIPYVEWATPIFENKAFLSIIKEVKGEASESTQKEIEKSQDSNFRGKFIAKHRATDGHMVRSKAEMLIDNWLYMAEIVHAYERKLPIEEVFNLDDVLPRLLLKFGVQTY